MLNAVTMYMYLEVQRVTELLIRFGKKYLLN